VLLEGRNAVICGGGGAIGGAAARAFAREGARVFLAGRHQASLERVAADICGAGGTAETADTAVRTTFLTSRAAGRLMVRQGSGVILAFGGSGDRRATTTRAASRSPSRPSRRCGGSSPPSWGATACGS
jgi:NAD(P)-dependent dehydrogenase (short-subunit alcohol dehydrogenase family)